MLVSPSLCNFVVFFIYNFLRTVHNYLPLIIIIMKSIWDIK